MSINYFLELKTIRKKCANINLNEIKCRKGIVGQSSDAEKKS